MVRRTLPVAAILIPPGVDFLDIVPFSAGCHAGAVWILEKYQRSATIQRCWGAVSLDELSRPTVARSLNSDSTKLIFSWHGSRRGVLDPRPALQDALWTASVMAAGVFCCAMHVEGIPTGELQERLSGLPWFRKALPIGAVTIWRPSWLSPAKWYPHPGVIGQTAHGRLIVRSYDRALFSHLLSFAFGGASLLLNLWFPLQITVCIWLCYVLLLRLGPNSAEWEFTADASLLNSAAHSGSRQNNCKRQLQRR
jgi:hypothetical protein